MRVLPPDNEIVESLQADDAGVFEQLFRHHYQPLCRFAVSILRDQDEAEEVVQDVMVKLWEGRSHLQINLSLKSYLYRMVHNACISGIRKEKVRHLHAAHVKSQEEMFHNDASAPIEKTELERMISGAIEQLPEQCRLVFKLSRFEQMKYSEIAQHLDISVKTVENHMGKALRMLRESLKDYLILLTVYFSLLY